MAKQSSLQDRNFDGLAERFKKNVYSGLKGAVRLAILERDFAQHLPFVSAPPVAPLRILDAGGGQGQFSLLLARLGHRVVICDISAEMLALAEHTVKEAQIEASVTLINCAIQDLPQHIEDCQFDLVLCHAVMEWLAEPRTLLPYLQQYLKPAGHISLTFYNRQSLIYKNLLRGNFKKVIAQDFTGARGSLTPINPLEPEQVTQWATELNFNIVVSSGIRVFHDYIFDATVRDQNPKSLLALELQFSQLEPYRSLGRYIHLLLCH